jgi:hypothetical protein
VPPVSVFETWDSTAASSLGFSRESSRVPGAASAPSTEHWLLGIDFSSLLTVTAVTDTQPERCDNVP